MADSGAEKTTILVVDDEDGIRHALHRFLVRGGHTVVEAANGGEALEQVKRAHPQAMLSDIRMPVMTGVELVPKALAADPDLAILMLTAIDEPRMAIDCLKLGAFDYLIKPVDLDELDLALQAALRRRQLEVERRNLESWLAREVAERTQELEVHSTAIEGLALELLADALAHSSGDEGRIKALAGLARRLAGERGVTVADLAKAIETHGQHVIDGSTVARFRQAMGA
jgi:DNA-binding NtrC family response regulator